MSMIAPVQSHYHEAYIVYWSRCRQTSFFFTSSTGTYLFLLFLLPMDCLHGLWDWNRLIMLIGLFFIKIFLLIPCDRHNCVYVCVFVHFQFRLCRGLSLHVIYNTVLF